MNTFKTTIDRKQVIVSDDLKGFDLYKRSSTNVDYFAINVHEKKIFFQFNSGQCYVYKEVLVAVLQEAVKAERIGKFFYANIKGRYEDEKLDDRCIRTDLREIDDEDETYSGDENVDDFLRDSMD